MAKNIDSVAEKKKPAPPKTLSLSIAGEEYYLIINSLDLYSRIWIGQYERIDDLCIYDIEDRWSRNSKRHNLFQQIRNILIPSLRGVGDYLSCSLGIWSDKTDIRAINAYDIQQRLRYEVSWFKNPEGGITVDFGDPLIMGNLGDTSVFCERTEDGVCALIYLSEEQLQTIQTALEVYRMLIDRDIKGAFQYFTSNDEALSVAEELSGIYEEYAYFSFSSAKDYGRKRYLDLKSGTTALIDKTIAIAQEKAYTEYIRVNIPPANPFLSLEEALKILKQPFEHFKKSRRKIPPKDVLKLPGAGFLTKMSGRERATTDYLLVWYEPATKTEYYYAGEDFIIKHGGVIDFPEDIKQFVRKKCRASKAKSSAGLS